MLSILPDGSPATAAPSGWRVNAIGWRNRLFASARFQRFASSVPGLRRIARSRARQSFDLVAGFVYTQTLLAMVEGGVLERLRDGPAQEAELAALIGASGEAAQRLVRAAAAIGLAEEVAPGWWMLGRHGAALAGNRGALAMVRHHRLLYADLADPLALLRAGRGEATALSSFWRYAADPGAHGAAADQLSPYSALMATSQEMVADEVLRAWSFSRAKALLDVGGGHGVFAARVAAAAPSLRIGVFDLPGVIEGAKPALAGKGLAGRIALHGGDFLRDSLPQGYDCISLVRILHDHDDAPALALLRAVRAALPPGGRLLIAEPMAATPGAEAMGDAYFGLYLWAMRQGRPRRADEIGAMLEAAGFYRWRRRTTGQPLVTSLIVATA